MKVEAQNNTSAIYRIRCRLATDKKKTITAVCLVVVMGIMWGRVLLNKGPQEVEAADDSTKVNEVKEKEQEQEVTYLELPKIPGRNDKITRDFFVPGEWMSSKGDKNKQNSTDNKGTEVDLGNGSEKMAEIITDSLKLQAVWLGPVPLARINDKDVHIGDKLPVTINDAEYECEVVRIEENRVVVRCEKVEVVLKIKVF